MEVPSKLLPSPKQKRPDSNMLPNALCTKPFGSRVALASSVKFGVSSEVVGSVWIDDATVALAVAVCAVAVWLLQVNTVLEFVCEVAPLFVSACRNQD